MHKISGTNCHRRMMQLIDLIWILTEIWASSRKSVSSSRNACSVSQSKRWYTLWSNRIWLSFTGDMTHEILSNQMICSKVISMFFFSSLVNWKNSDVELSIVWAAHGLSARHRKSALSSTPLLLCSCFKFPTLQALISICTKFDREFHRRTVCYLFVNSAHVEVSLIELDQWWRTDCKICVVRRGILIHDREDPAIGLHTRNFYLRTVSNLRHIDAPRMGMDTTAKSQTPRFDVTSPVAIGTRNLKSLVAGDVHRLWSFSVMDIVWIPFPFELRFHSFLRLWSNEARVAPEPAQFKLGPDEILTDTNLPYLTQFWRLFIFPWVFLRCRIILDLHVGFGSAVRNGFDGDFLIFVSTMRARTWFKISSRSVAPKKCTQSHLDHLCTFDCRGCFHVGSERWRDLSFQSCGNGASGAHPSWCSGSWRFGERNSEGKESERRRTYGANAWPESQVNRKESLDSNLEKTMPKGLKRVASKVVKPTIRLTRTRRRYHYLAQQVQQIPRGNVPSGVKPFSIPESEELDNQARKIECGTLVLEPEGTWRDMKNNFCDMFKETSLTIDASMAYDQMRELEKTADYESFMQECLACESVSHSTNSTLETDWLSEGLFDSVEQTALTRAKATMLMKAMLKRMANEQEAQKNAES